ncbi:MAG TPA: hypothetical protein VF950_29660, partial [Planctomycetota bacterium]
MIRPAVPLILALLTAASAASAQEVGGYMNSDGVVRTLYFGETTREAGVLTFGCFGGDMTVVAPATKTMRLIIPAGLNVEWDPASPWFFGGPQVGKVQGFSLGTKTLTITTTAGGLLPGDIFTLSGMRYTTIGAGSSDALFLDKDGDATFTSHAFAVDDRDPATNTITVASNPFFTVSGGSQIFRTGDPDTVCGQINIQEQASFPAIKVGTGIRIQIPAGLNMSWDTLITSVTVAGSASGKVDNLAVTYPTSKVALIPVTTDFVANDTLTINGLEFSGFGVASGPLGLQLVVNGGTLASTTSAQTFRVAGIPTMSMTQQNFGVNDPNTTNNQISITNVPVGDVTMITSTNDIEIRIPAGLPIVWALDFSPSFSFAGSGVNGAVGAVSYSGDQKSLFIDVTTTFDPGRILRIDNLTFSGFGSASAADSLELDVDTDGTSETTTGANLRVVQPTISIAGTTYNAGEEATNAPSILVTNSNPGRIRALDATGNIRIRIPAGLSMIWDTSVTAPGLVIGGAGTGVVAANVTYPIVDNKTVQIDVTTDFSAGQTLTITGLRFTNFAASGPAGLELDVASAGTTVHTSVGQIQVGGTPSILSASPQSFTFGDSNLASTSAASDITITDASGVPMITTAGDIRIKIPAAYNMTWDTSVLTIGSNNAKVSTTLLAYADSNKTAVLNVITSNFGSGESVTVSGLRFANFATTGSTNLQLEVDGDPAVEDDDGVTKAIGRPNIASASNQLFNQGEESTAAAQIVITDDATFPRIRAVDATGDIRIRIPTGLNMEWDPSVTTVSAVMGGPGGSGNVSSSVSYEPGNKVVRIDVTADFVGGKTVTILGLKFQNFGAVSSGNLELICSGTETTTVCRVDAQSITIGSTASISSPAQSFTFNDSSALSTSVATDILITDATGVPMITTGNDIRIKIPAGLGLTWDSGVNTIGSNNAKVSTTVLGYEDSNRTVVLNVITTNFGSGESVTVTGLRFANFVAVGSTQIELEVDGDPLVEDQDTLNSKSIGRPTISSTVNQTFNQDEEATAAATIRVSDGAVPRVRSDNTTGDIRIRIPAGLNMTWNTAITTVTATVTGTGVVSSTLLAYEDSNRTAVLNVTTSFGANAFVDISGLQFFPFSGASGPLSLQLIVNGVPAGPNSVCNSDDKTIQIGGRVTVSSATNQFLVVGDAAVNASAITVTDAPGVPMINTTTGLRLVIPAGLGVTWNTGITTIGSTNGKVTQTGVTYVNGNRTAVLIVNANFTAGESTVITGLQFATPTLASTGSLEVEVDGDVATEDVDDKTITIGGPTMASAGVQNFTKNDPAIAMSMITITEAAGGASIRDGNNIRIRIPAGVNMTWNTGVTAATFGGTASGRVVNPVTFEPGNKTVIIEVTTDFAAGQTLTVSGLQYTAFGNSSTGNLTLEVDGDSSAEATDTQQVRIGSPTISSAANQSFNVLDPITPISQIVLTEDPANPRMSAAGDIRIRIPASLNMEWDTTDTVGTLNVGGAGAGVVGGVTFPEGPKIMLINVTTGFSVNQTLTISGFGFANFSAESSTAPLELVVNSGALTTCNVDDKTKQIGGQASLSSAAQSFAVNDPPTACTALVITDAPGSPKITTANGIQIKIPAGLNMTWNTAITTITSTNGKVTQTGVTYADANKTAVLIVNANFVASEATTITGLQFDNFVAGSGQLTLELDGDATAEATDVNTKGIGAPTLSSSGSQVFLVGPGPTGASSFTITDDGTFPRIRAATGLRVRIPAALNMVWQNLGTAGIVMGAGSGNVSTTVAYADAFKTLVLTVTSDFVASQTVTVSGLAFQTFSAPSTPDFLRLEVTASGFTTDLDNQSKAIQGSPTIASASQGFTINDPATTATNVVITDAGGVATITNAQNIRIVIPPGLNMLWDTSVV